MKKFLIAVMILLCVTCAGCFQAKVDLIITDEGAIVEHCKFTGNAFVIRQIEEWKAQNEQFYPDLRAKPIVAGDLRGYEFDLNYPDLESYANSAGDLQKVYAGRNKGISRRKGWFFDACEFDFYFATPPAKLPPEAEYFTQAAFKGVAYDVTIQLPYSADSTDADEVSADGKYLRWNLSPVLIHGGERFMNVRFKLWHEEKIALTAAVELLLLAAAIFFFVKARAEESASVRKDLLFKRNVFAGLFAALTIISAYMILAPVTFTDADIISLTVNH